MTAHRSWQPGELARAECHELKGARVIATVPVLSVLHLHCGCDKLTVDRPGRLDESNRWKASMDLLANRCGLHTDRMPPAPEWVEMTPSAGVA